MGIRAPVDAASGRKYFVWVTQAPARNARRRKFNRPGLLPSTSVSAFRPKRKHPPGLVTWPRSGQVSARPSRAGLLARLTAESRCARLRVCTPPMIRGPRPGISARASRLVLVAHLGIGSKRSKCRSVRGPKHRTTIEEKLIGGERLGRIAPQAEDGTPCTSCRSVARSLRLSELRVAVHALALYGRSRRSLSLVRARAAVKWWLRWFADSGRGNCHCAVDSPSRTPHSISN
jgi:hypothetical protein